MSYLFRTIFDEKLKFASDGKFLDNFIDNFLYKTSDLHLAGFVLGGASLRNFAVTLQETQSYRPTDVHDHKMLRTKSKLRQILLKSSITPIIKVFPSMYLSIRDKKIRRKFGI